MKKKLFLAIGLLLVSIICNIIMLCSGVVKIGAYSSKSSDTCISFANNTISINHGNDWGVFLVKGKYIYTKLTNNSSKFAPDYIRHNIFSIEDMNGNIYKNNFAIVIQVCLGIADVALLISIFILLKKLKKPKEPKEPDTKQTVA